MNDKQFICPGSGPIQSFTHQYPIMPGTFSPTNNFNEIYSSLLPQNSLDRRQNKTVPETSFVYSELPAWDNVKLPDKIDLVELSSKDLSPSNYYGIIDPITPTTDTQFNRYEAPQWGNNTNNYSQKMGNYPSCAQVGRDKDTFKSCAYYNNSNTYYSENKQNDQGPSIYGNYLSYYDPKYMDYTSESGCLGSNSLSYISGILQKPESSQKSSYELNYLSTLDSQNDEESDIVVEDSSSDYSEDQEQRHDTTKCLACNTQYTPLGLQFFIITSEKPLTMSSQIPVKRKISEFISNNVFYRTKNYLCNDCLGLVNTIDHLQLKLDGLVKDLLRKLKESCTENNLIFRGIRGTINKRFGKYKCKKCYKVLCIKTCLKAHVSRHQPKVYLCEMCGKRLSSFKRLQLHLKQHKKPTVPFTPAFKCSNRHCNKTFKTKFNLKEHENYCLGLLPFRCKNAHCNKKFASSTRLKSHMKLKHDKKFIAICSICNIGFIKASDYKSHMTSHSTDKKFSCTKCDKTYKTLSNLNFHLKSHKKTLPYICSICQKGFMRKEYHEAHMNNHKGIKNFACPYCDKKFVAQKNLDAHLKYHEGTVKSNTCNVCKKVITSCFEEHLKVHANLKEFECDLCEMRFNTKNALSKHRKKHESLGEVT